MCDLVREYLVDWVGFFRHGSNLHRSASLCRPRVMAGTTILGTVRYLSEIVVELSEIGTNRISG